jgi:hypothetical protein
MVRDLPSSRRRPPSSENRDEALERYKAYRAQIEHEDQLMGIRIGWLIGSEAFLFAAYANVASAGGSWGTASRLLDILPKLGIAIAVLISFAIVAAIIAIQRLRRSCPPDDVLRALKLPPMISGKLTHRIGLIPACLLPIVLCLAWHSVAS